MGEPGETPVFLLEWLHHILLLSLPVNTQAKNISGMQH